MKLAKNSSLAELASSFAELETWAQDIPLGILAQKTLIVYSEMIKLMWIEKGLRMPWEWDGEWSSSSLWGYV